MFDVKYIEWIEILVIIFIFFDFLGVEDGVGLRWYLWYVFDDDG